MKVIIIFLSSSLLVAALELRKGAVQPPGNINFQPNSRLLYNGAATTFTPAAPAPQQFLHAGGAVPQQGAMPQQGALMPYPGMNRRPLTVAESKAQQLAKDAAAHAKAITTAQRTGLERFSINDIPLSARTPRTTTTAKEFPGSYGACGSVQNGGHMDVYVKFFDPTQQENKNERVSAPVAVKMFTGAKPETRANSFASEMQSFKLLMDKGIDKKVFQRSIIKFYGYAICELTKQYFLIMEYAEAKDLHNFANVFAGFSLDSGKSVNKLDEESLIELENPGTTLLDIAAEMAWTFKAFEDVGVQHRDIKPQNVVLKADIPNCTYRPVICDLGFMTYHKQLCGTPAYVELATDIVPDLLFRGMTQRTEKYAFLWTILDCLCGNSKQISSESYLDQSTKPMYDREFQKRLFTDGAGFLEATQLKLAPTIIKWGPYEAQKKVECQKIIDAYNQQSNKKHEVNGTPHAVEVKYCGMWKFVKPDVRNAIVQQLLQWVADGPKRPDWTRIANFLSQQAAVQAGKQLDIDNKTTMKICHGRNQSIVSELSTAVDSAVVSEEQFDSLDSSAVGSVKSTLRGTPVATPVKDHLDNGAAPSPFRPPKPSHRETRGRSSVFDGPPPLGPGHLPFGSDRAPQGVSRPASPSYRAPEDTDDNSGPGRIIGVSRATSSGRTTGEPEDGGVAVTPVRTGGKQEQSSQRKLRPLVRASSSSRVPVFVKPLPTTSTEQITGPATARAAAQQPVSRVAAQQAAAPQQARGVHVVTRQASAYPYPSMNRTQPSITPNNRTQPSITPNNNVAGGAGGGGGRTKVHRSAPMQPREIKNETPVRPMHYNTVQKESSNKSIYRL